MRALRNIIATLCVSFLLVACGEKKAEDTLVVGISAEYPPFSYKENNEVVGFDVDLAHLIAKKMGKNLEIKNFDFPTLIPALQSEHVDILISALSVTPERKQVVDFSIPYFETQFAIVSRKDQPITSIETIQNTVIGAQVGSIMLTYINEHIKPEAKNKVLTLNSNLNLIEALKNNRVDVVVVETAQAIEFTAHNPTLIYSAAGSTGVGYAIACRKNSPLTETINAALQSLKTEGELSSLNKKWIETK